MPKIDPKYFYLAALQKHGIDAKALCWSSKENQQIRFKVIRQALPQNLSDITIADAGCGFGDLWFYFKKHKEQPKTYIGIESLEHFAYIAKEKTKQQILNLDILTATLPKSDYYICSGTLNTLTSFESFLFVKKCLDASKNGVIFNFLYGNKKSDIYNYINDTKIEKMCKSFHAKIFFEADDYLKNDKTIGLKKCAQSLE